MDPELLKRIDALAEKVGQTGERLFASLTQRAVTVAWVDIVCVTLLSAALAFFGSRIARSGLRDREEDTLSYWDLKVFVGGLMLFIAVVVPICCIPEQVVNLMYPEAAALKTLLGK